MTEQPKPKKKVYKFWGRDSTNPTETKKKGDALVQKGALFQESNIIKKPNKTGRVIKS